MIMKIQNFEKLLINLIHLKDHQNHVGSLVFKILFSMVGILKYSNRPVAGSIAGGGANIYMFVFTDHENNRFQNTYLCRTRIYEY